MAAYIIMHCIFATVCHTCIMYVKNMCRMHAQLTKVRSIMHHNH